MTIATFKLMCISVLQCVMQVEPDTDIVTKAYKHKLQRLTCGPYHALSYNMLVLLMQLGFPFASPDILAASNACRIRIATKCPGVGDCWEDLKRVLDSNV
eukprot:2307411-Pyramimonas_sp.AAC.1